MKRPARMTHVAVRTHDVDASIDFYRRYAGLSVAHERCDDGVRVVWLGETPHEPSFVIVLMSMEHAEAVDPSQTDHFGFDVASRDEVDRIAALAEREGRLKLSARDLGPIVGYITLVRDPSGNICEFSHGQSLHDRPGGAGMTLEEARRIALQKYGSLEEPRFDFVTEALAARPYASLLEELASSLAVEEDTDPNDDVSFGFVLRRADRTWILRLSMVARVAMLLRTRAGALEVVSRASGQAPDADEGAVLDRLEKHGVRALSREELEVPLPMQLFNVGPEECRVYQAFFSDTDRLPWA